MKKICLIIAIMLTFPVLAQAYITSDEMTTQEFFRNDGFSPEVHSLVRIETEPEKLMQERTEAKKNKFVFNLKKFYTYLDPYTNQGNFGIKDYDTKDNSFKGLINF